MLAFRKSHRASFRSIPSLFIDNLWVLKIKIKFYNIYILTILFNTEQCKVILLNLLIILILSIIFSDLSFLLRLHPLCGEYLLDVTQSATNIPITSSIYINIIQIRIISILFLFLLLYLLSLFCIKS
jgi:hypothetical protein